MVAQMDISSSGWVMQNSQRELVVKVKNLHSCARRFKMDVVAPPRQQRQDHDFATITSDRGRLRQVSFLIVAAFDMYFRFKRVDQALRRSVVKGEDTVHAAQFAQDGCAVFQGVHRAVWAFAERPNTLVRIESHDQEVAQGPRLPEVVHVAGVKDIEHAIRKDELPAFPQRLGRVQS